MNPRDDKGKPVKSAMRDAPESAEAEGQRIRQAIRSLGTGAHLVPAN
jgi:hypothetical protein